MAWAPAFRGPGSAAIAACKCCRCTIPVVGTEPQLVPPPPAPERNWLPLAIAAAVVLVLGGGLIFILDRGKSAPSITPISAPLDPYAASLSITHLAMSESSNLAGGKVTYLDGQIVNQGSRTVTAVSAQVLFRNFAHEVAWNETQPLQIIRARDPYIDTEPVSAAPLLPGDQRDFRLAFDTVPDSWDGAYPEIRVVRVTTK